MTSIDPEATSKTGAHDPASRHGARHGAFELGGVHCRGCADAVERALRAQPHVTDVRLDWKNDLVHVGYDPTRIGPEDIEGVITQTGCDCKPTEVGEEHHHEAMAPPQRRMQHLEHGVDAQPISMGTKHDRMQYEAPATQADHMRPSHMGDHMGHDMSDPGMAAAMERDMRNRFFVALLLTIPTVLYSPLGMNLLGLRLPTFGLGENVIMLLLTTPVVFYSGWIFISGSYHSLRQPHAQHERAHRHGRARRLPLQRPDHLHGRRDVLRSRRHARHLRPLRPLDGDALQARHQRRPAGALRPRAAAGDRDQGRRRGEDPEQRGASRRHRRARGPATRCPWTARSRRARRA